MKRRHNRHNPVPPPWYIPRSAELTEDYEREVQRSTDKLERAYARAQKRAEQAETQLTQAKKQRGVKRHLVVDLEALVTLRHTELEEYRRLMETAPASATHRGTKSYRPVPPPD